MARLCVPLLTICLLVFSFTTIFPTRLAAPVVYTPLAALPLLNNLPTRHTDLYSFCIPHYYDMPMFVFGDSRVPTVPTFRCGQRGDSLTTSINGEYGRIREIWYSLPSGATFNLNELWVQYGTPFRMQPMRGGAYFRWKVDGGVIVAYMSRRTGRVGALQVIIMTGVIETDV